MRVGVDATSWNNRRGFGRFTRNAVRRLVEQHEDAEYVLYIDEGTSRQAELPERATERLVRLSEAPSKAAAAGSRRTVGDLIRLTAAVRADRPDAFLFPSVYTYFPVIGVPTVLGVHDAITRELPELTLSTRRDRLAWRAKEAYALRSATRVFTVSEASRTALSERFGLLPADVPIVPEGPDDIFYPRATEAIETARHTIGLAPGEPYFVFAGGISPHKNVETLLRGYGRLAGRRSPVPRLVIVGDLTTETFLSSAGAVRALVGSLGLVDSVLFPGFIDDDLLAAVYSGATAVVIPSLAEGFGLPAVEGAACGAPMVLSDLPAHRETLDGAAVFFPPTSDERLAEVLTEVLDDPGGAAEMAARGRECAQRLSWDRAVGPLRELIDTVAHERGGRR